MWLSWTLDPARPHGDLWSMKIMKSTTELIPPTVNQGGQIADLCTPEQSSHLSRDIPYWRMVTFIGIDQFSGEEGKCEPSVANTCNSWGPGAQAWKRGSRLGTSNVYN